MRDGPAFRFIPELVGDIAHVLEISSNPTQLYIESGLATIKTASKIFQAIQEHKNTEQIKENAQIVREKSSQTAELRITNLEEEKIYELDLKYKRIQSKIVNSQFRDRTVRIFLHDMSDILSSFLKQLESIKEDSNNLKQREELEEIYRKALRDYNRILMMCIQEDGNNV